MFTEHLLLLMCHLQFYCYKNVFFHALRDDLFSTERKTAHKNSSLVSLVQEWTIISQWSQKSVCVLHWILTLPRVGADGTGPGHSDSIQGKRALFRLTLLLGEVVSSSLELPIPFNKFSMCHLKQYVCLILGQGGSDDLVKSFLGPWFALCSLVSLSSTGRQVGEKKVSN